MLINDKHILRISKMFNTALYTLISVILKKSSPKKPVGRLLVNCWSRNREKTLRFVLMFYRQATDRLPTHYQQSADCWPTVSRQVAYISGKTCWPSNGRQSANCWPTDDRQSADRFFGELFFTITLISMFM